MPGEYVAFSSSTCKDDQKLSKGQPHLSGDSENMFTLNIHTSAMNNIIPVDSETFGALRRSMTEYFASTVSYCPSREQLTRNPTTQDSVKLGKEIKMQEDEANYSSMNNARVC